MAYKSLSGRMIRRGREDSPIYKRMMSEVSSPEEYEAAQRYGDKVDAFAISGEVRIDQLEYVGPDLSPGAERENCMKGVRRVISKPIPGSDGRRTVPLTGADAVL